MTLAEALEMAEAAKNYARKLIIKGATQIENNQLSFEQSNDLGQGLKDLRDMINVDMSGEEQCKKSFKSN